MICPSIVRLFPPPLPDHNNAEGAPPSIFRVGLGFSESWVSPSLGFLRVFTFVIG
jgi:hypothetical protein